MGCALPRHSCSDIQGFGADVMTFEVLKSLDSGMGCTLGDYKFLYGFVSLIRPRRIVDIGTNHGLSAIAMAMALRDGGLTESRIISVDIIEGYLKKAQAQINQLGLSKYVKLVCGDSSVIKDYPPFDVAFIDGDHTLKGCLRDFETVKDRATYILIHDTVAIDAITRAVKEIRKTGEYDILNANVGNRGTQWSLNKVVYRSYSGIAIIKVRECLK